MVLPRPRAQDVGTLGYFPRVASKDCESPATVKDVRKDTTHHPIGRRTCVAVRHLPDNECRDARRSRFVILPVG